MQTITQAPELARTVPSQFVSHPHVHVEGQSESTLHGPVCWAAQVFHDTLVQVVPASQMEGIGKPPRAASPNALSGVGTAPHETVVTLAYEGSLASWSFPQL
jgi:hypothetical protein